MIYLHKICDIDLLVDDVAGEATPFSLIEGP